jgi:DNA-binding HxlR family transcriptional regulator
VTRGYGQFCGLARALELVGSRWTLLVVRDLLTGPKRFTDLEHGLLGIPTNVLASRLRELEDEGLVERSLVARTSSVVYRLTPYGRELEGPLVALGMWGAKALGEPDETKVFNLSALMLALRGRFRQERAGSRDLAVEIRLRGDTLNVLVSGGRVEFPTELPSKARLVIEVTPGVVASLLHGSTDVPTAVESGRLRVDGPVREAGRFFEMFRIPVSEPTPAV